MKTVTPAQLKLIHALLNQADLMDRKGDMVYSFSNGRVESSRELSIIEAKEMIEYLKQATDGQRLIKAIWFIAYDMKIISGNGTDHNGMNAAKLDTFCKTRGTIKKNLREQSYKELKKTHRQFEAMYRKYKEKQKTKKMIEQLENKIATCVIVEDYEACAVLKREMEKIKKPVKRKQKSTVNQ